MGISSDFHSRFKSRFAFSLIEKSHRHRSLKYTAPLTVIDFILCRSDSIAGKGIQKTFFGISPEVHKFFTDQTNLPLMGLASHPALLAPPRFYPGLAVKPAHIPAVNAVGFFHFLCVRP